MLADNSCAQKQRQSGQELPKLPDKGKHCGWSPLKKKQQKKHVQVMIYLFIQRLTELRGKDRCAKNIYIYCAHEQMCFPKSDLILQI